MYKELKKIHTKFEMCKFLKNYTREYVRIENTIYDKEVVF